MKATDGRRTPNAGCKREAIHCKVEDCASVRWARGYPKTLKMGNRIKRHADFN
jgi:hypothetical protein